MFSRCSVLRRGVSVLLHCWCAGVTRERYAVLSSTEDPFLCPSCTIARQQAAIASQQEDIARLREYVSSLTDEVRELKATVATMQSQTNKTCGRCGRSQHDRQQCPARDAVCHKCAWKGHFKSMCRSTAKIQEVQLENAGSTAEEAFLGHLTQQGASPSPWAVTLFLNGKPIQFEIDTGAEVLVISQRAHQEIGSPTLQPPQRTLQGPCNHAVPAKGQFTGKLRQGEREVD